MKILAAVDGSSYPWRMHADLTAQDEWPGTAHSGNIIDAVPVRPAVPPRAAAALPQKKDGHGLIILGSHGHGTLQSLVMGSVSAKVLSHCDTPVRLIR